MNPRGIPFWSTSWLTVAFAPAVALGTVLVYLALSSSPSAFTATWTALAALVGTAILLRLARARRVSRKPRAPAARALDPSSPWFHSSLLGLEDDEHGTATSHEEDRSDELRISQQRLQDLIAAGLNMSRERDMMKLLKRILQSAQQLTGCDAATLYTVTEHKTLRFAIRTREDQLPTMEIPLFNEQGEANLHFVSTHVAHTNAPVVIDDVYAERRFDLSGTKSFDARTAYRTVSMLALPLAPREGEVIGVLQLMNAVDADTGKVGPFGTEAIRLASALAAQAAVSLDNHQLVNSQQELMDSLVKLIAGAIDAKSPYTGSHCERVPALAIMLAEEAHNAREGAFANFRFDTADQWREFRIGAWLHDCGKMTTPEYVIDKATKLETIYDRIHEIRTRFEVLWRDAEIQCLRAQRDGMDEAQAVQARDAEQARLLEDFAFVAECNRGTESMAPERTARLREIGARNWIRHFDDRLGLAHGVVARLKDIPPTPVPAVERLLADKPEHLIDRPDSAATDPKYGFKMDIPDYLYNHGELYNLGIKSGTLTPEERYTINQHIKQTIIMLESLPFPKNLRRVPEYAGTHHETLLGTGYPRRLDAAALSVPARIMAVADIFEALTASDRPYKEPKTLSQAVEILHGFKKRRHIDPDVYDLLLSSGVYQRFAERFLAPELIDNVDVSSYLASR